MKKLINTIAWQTSLITLAQSSKENIEAFQFIFGQTKRAFIRTQMNIDDSIANSEFWDIYDEYETQRRRMMECRFHLIKMYIDNHSSFENETEGDIATSLIDNACDIDTLNERYFVKFKRAIGAKEAYLLFKIELYFQSTVQCGRNDQISLISQLQTVKEYQ
jgi:hypothetical protein